MDHPKYQKAFLDQIAQTIGDSPFRESSGISCARALSRDDHELAHEIAPRLRGVAVSGWKIRTDEWIEPWFVVLDSVTLVKSVDGKIYDPNGVGKGVFLPDRTTPHDRENQISWASIMISSRVFEAGWSTYTPWSPIFIATRNGKPPFNYSDDPAYAHQKVVRSQSEAEAFLRAKGLKITPRNMMAVTSLDFTQDEVRRAAIRNEKPRLISNFRDIGIFRQN